MASKKTSKKAAKSDAVVIKKYANRRLYDTGRSSYVTLDDLCEMVQDGYDFVVYDAKSGEDITRSVLTQIIVDKEGKSSDGDGLLPTNFMKQLIGFYGDNVQGLVPNYLENSFEIFVTNQERMREQINKSFEGMNSTMPGMFPPSNLEELNRKNMEMFERTMDAMKIFNPFSYQSEEEDSK